MYFASKQGAFFCKQIRFCAMNTYGEHIIPRPICLCLNMDRFLISIQTGPQVADYSKALRV